MKLVVASAVVLIVFDPIDSHAERVVIGVIGDYGVNRIQAEQVATLVREWNPNFVMTVGDNDYVNNFDFAVGRLYHEFIYPYSGVYGTGATSNRFFPCLGNHDFIPNYTNYFTLPGNERYYNYRQGPVEIFAVNSEEEPDGTSSGSIQGRWLQEQLARSPARWKLVYFHRAAYSSGAVWGSHPNMQWPYETWGASAVLSGHDHTYERLIVGSIPYFVNGLGGNSPYAFADPPLPQSRVRYNQGNGAMRIMATETNMLFEFINVSREVIDSFSLPAVMGAPFVTSQPTNRIARPYTNVTFRVGADGAPPLTYRWFHNGSLLADAASSDLVLSNVVPAHEGSYSAMVSNHVSTTMSDAATLTLLKDPVITGLQRRAYASTVPAGAQVTLRVFAQGAGPLRCQWRFNGADFPGGTDLTLVISNALVSHTGEYRALVRDDFGSILSDPFQLLVLIPPSVVVPPLGQSMVQGGYVTFSVVAAGDLPINYAWRQGGTVLTNMLLNSYTSFFTLRNLQFSNAGSYRVALTNFSSPTPMITTNAALSVLADADRDLMADAWETNFTFLTNSPADALEDADGDGMSNRQEYFAGTDPRAAASLLRVELASMPAGEPQQVTLRFAALSNRTYLVQRGTTFSNWTGIAELVALPTNRSVELSFPIEATPARFYRLSTPWTQEGR